MERGIARGEKSLHLGYPIGGGISRHQNKSVNIT
jgi:hypothetical protein